MPEETKNQKDPHLSYLKLQTILIALILAVILVFVLFTAVKVNDVVALAQAIDPQQVNDAVASLKSAADTLSQVDMESLNTAIQGLSQTSQDLSALDFEKLSNFLDSLDTLSTQMDAISDLFKGFLGR